MHQTRHELKRGPWIGERAACWLTDDVIAIGTIIDIRDCKRTGSPETEPPIRCVLIGILGWPQMMPVPVAQYQELHDGVWRACTHSRGFNAADLCFDCGITSVACRPPVNGGSSDTRDVDGKPFLGPA